jgi:nucleoside-diphosphate-sugar epimerase
MNIFVAGATGVIGRRLVPLLRDAGHLVTGATRFPEKAAALEALGVRSTVLDVLDARALLKAVYASHPDIIIHQLTDLPPAPPETAQMHEVLERNAQLREQGTRNLMAAAAMAGAKRVIAQSIAFAYAAGSGPRVESDPFEGQERGEPIVTARGALALEQQVQNAPEMQGIVLRYGRLYGPGTWRAEAEGPAPLHVDAAAHAAFLAVTGGAPGIYNIAEEDGYASIDKARRELGFDPNFRMISSR